MSHTGRKGEPPKLRPRRSERVFEVNGGWYINTREGTYVGAYPTKMAASDAANELIALLDGVDDANVAAAFVREFVRRTVGVNWWVQARTTGNTFNSVERCPEPGDD